MIFETKLERSIWARFDRSQNTKEIADAIGLAEHEVARILSDLRERMRADEKARAGTPPIDLWEMRDGRDDTE